MTATKKLLSYIFVCFCVLCLTCSEKDETPSNYLDYKTIAELELPFDDGWFVVWGGRVKEENYHASLVDQRFAIDVVQIENGSTFIGNGKQNEDYYCYGDTLYAPEAGQIVEVENSIFENIPGETNTNQLFGNYIILDHGNAEFSVLAHFMKNSIIVNKGDFLAKGEVIGLSGNSGNSTEPHLHYHLQNQPSIGQGEGLPAQFRNYYANNVFVPIGEPLKNQIIRKD